MRSFSQTLKPYSCAILTGGSSGIGRSFIDHLLKDAPDLEIGNLSRSVPEGFSPENPSRRHFSCDLSKESARFGVFQEVMEWVGSRKQGKLLLINNSGFGAYGRFPEPGVSRNSAMIGVNVSAPVELTGHLLPVLRERGGSVINVASTAAFQPTPFLSTYGATKAFLSHWSLSLSQELKGEGVRVLCLCPGPTSTAFFSAAGFREAPLEGRGQTPDQVVRTALRAMARGKILTTSGWGNRLLAASVSKLPKAWAARAAFLVLKKLRLERFQ